RDFHVTGVQTCALPIFIEVHPLNFWKVFYPILLRIGQATIVYFVCRVIFWLLHLDVFTQQIVLAFLHGIRFDLVTIGYLLLPSRSEERRVGKECSSRWL